MTTFPPPNIGHLVGEAAARQIMHSMCTSSCGPECNVVAPTGDMRERTGDKILAEDALSTRTECIIDGKPIHMLAFKMTGVCCEYCRKVRDGEIVDERS